jgi:hypothetical protein
MASGPCDKHTAPSSFCVLVVGSYTPPLAVPPFAVSSASDSPPQPAMMSRANTRPSSFMIDPEADVPMDGLEQVAARRLVRVGRARAEAEQGQECSDRVSSSVHQ